MYRAPITAADDRLRKARSIVRARDALIARRDEVTAEIAKLTADAARLEKEVDDRARGFLGLSYRPQKAEDVVRLHAIAADLTRLTDELLGLGAQLAAFHGAVRELAAAREAKHAILFEAGAPTSADLEAISAQLAREDAIANELDDAIAVAVRADLPLREAAALLRALDSREGRRGVTDAAPRRPGKSARGLAVEARTEAQVLWARVGTLGIAVSHEWLGQTFASLLAYIQVDGRIIEARATSAAILAELAAVASVLHQRAAQVAARVAALVTERDHLLE